MKHLSTEGFTALSQEELLHVEGGGFLTDLTGKLVAGVTEVVGVVKNVTTAAGSFLKTIVGILV
jgi:hypothetical protein